MIEEKQLENQKKVKMPWQIKVIIGFCFVLNMGILIKGLLFGFDGLIDASVFIFITIIISFIYVHLEFSNWKNIK